MKVFQVTLTGYDGGTDKTDDKIIWCVAKDIQDVDKLLRQMGVRFEDIHPTDLDLTVAGIDFWLLPPTKYPLKETVEQLEKEMNEFIDSLNSEVVDGLIRYDLNDDPVLIKAVEIVSRWRTLESMGIVFESDTSRWSSLDDNIDSWM